jgi:hypothetical protein
MYLPSQVWSILGRVRPPQTKADLRPDDPVQSLPKEISATFEDLASAPITNSKNQESIGASQKKLQEHSDPAPENQAALSHHTESSSQTSSLPIPQHDEPISQVHPDSEKNEEPPSLPIYDGPFSGGNRESESAAEPVTFTPSTNAEPLSELPPEVEVAEAPSITALSVDANELSDDSALGDSSIE